MSRIRQRIYARSERVLGFGVLCLALAGIGARAQTVPQTPELERLIYSVKGPDLFRAHCAACHGEDAKGGGPVAFSLTAKVPDLSVLAKNNKGVFPAADVRRMIAGDEIADSHGSREMPIWGPIFHRIEWDQDLGDVRLENLVKYLVSIQQK
jgi:mono/diheme cytochrome c family protein